MEYKVRDYGSLQPHQQRVVDERSELNDKSTKLDEFIQGEFFKTLSPRQQYLLKKQLWLMEEYGKVLDLRIEDFYQNEFQEETEFSRGEQLIGFFGNEKWDVFVLKAIASTFINAIDEKGKDGRLKAIATTEIETAQMFAVKSLF